MFFKDEVTVQLAAASRAPSPIDTFFCESLFLETSAACMWRPRAGAKLQGDEEYQRGVWKPRQNPWHAALVCARMRTRMPARTHTVDPGRTKQPFDGWPWMHPLTPVTQNWQISQTQPSKLGDTDPPRLSTVFFLSLSPGNCVVNKDFQKKKKSRNIADLLLSVLRAEQDVALNCASHWAKNNKAKQKRVKIVKIPACYIWLYDFHIGKKNWVYCP